MIPFCLKRTPLLPTLLTLYAEQARKDAATRIKQLQLKKRINLSTDPLRDLTASGGDKRLKAIRHTLATILKSRSEDQTLFHESFIHATLPHIFGNDWSENSFRVLQQENISKLETEVLVRTARRWGKTFAVAMFVASMLLNVPGIRIACFSTGSRASGNLMETVCSFLTNTPQGQSRIIRRTQEHLYLASRPLPAGKTATSGYARALCDAPDTSRFISLPATVDGQFLINRKYTIAQINSCHCLHIRVSSAQIFSGDSTPPFSRTVALQCNGQLKKQVRDLLSTYAI